MILEKVLRARSQQLLREIAHELHLLPQGPRAAGLHLLYEMPDDIQRILDDRVVIALEIEKQLLEDYFEHRDEGGGVGSVWGLFLDELEYLGCALKVNKIAPNLLNILLLYKSQTSPRPPISYCRGRFTQMPPGT